MSGDSQSTTASAASCTPALTATYQRTSSELEEERGVLFVGTNCVAYGAVGAKLDGGVRCFPQPGSLDALPQRADAVRLDHFGNAKLRVDLQASLPRLDWVREVHSNESCGASKAHRRKGIEKSHLDLAGVRGGRRRREGE